MDFADLETGVAVEPLAPKLPSKAHTVSRSRSEPALLSPLPGTSEMFPLRRRTPAPGGAADIDHIDGGSSPDSSHPRTPSPSVEEEHEQAEGMNTVRLRIGRRHYFN